MKTVQRSKLLIGSLLLISSSICAQQRGKIKEILLKDRPTAFSVDTEHHLYLGYRNGSLEKYSQDGVEFPPFSLPNQSAITLIEAQNNRKIFLFYRDIQQITILDRFSAMPKSYVLRDFGVYLATAACPAPDGTFWTIENNPRRLKKIDPLRKITVHEVQHALGDTLYFMRAYHNLFFVCDEAGVHVLDQFGSLVRSFGLTQAKYLQLHDGKLLVTTAEGVYQLDLYRDTSPELLEVPNKASADAFFSLGDRSVLLRDRTLSFYE